MEKRLFIVSGKGGVGKTIFSLSLALYLKKLGKKVIYNHFDQEPPIDLCKSLNIPFATLTDEECLKSYISEKLNSIMLGNWVVKAPFFQSLFNILPAFKNLVYLGFLIKKLEREPDLIIVLDSPASGHALTLLESPGNFREILKTGPLVSDIKKIEKSLRDQEFTQIAVLFLPTSLALHEAEELKEGILNLKLPHPQMILNNSFLKMPALGEDLPPFLKQKYKMEKELIHEYERKCGPLNKIIPHIPQLNQTSLVEKIQEVIRKW